MPQVSRADIASVSKCYVWGLPLERESVTETARVGVGRDIDKRCGGVRCGLPVGCPQPTPEKHPKRYARNRTPSTARAARRQGYISCITPGMNRSTLQDV